MVCGPKEEGGLGVINISLQNKVLLMNNLHKFYNRLDIPWVQFVWEKHYHNGLPPYKQTTASFWWLDILKLIDTFKQLVVAKINNGATTFFWTDHWQGDTLDTRWPHLHSFAKNKHDTVQDFMQNEQKETLFYLPLLLTAYDQFTRLLGMLENVAQAEDQDTWTYIWKKDSFIPAEAYRAQINHLDLPPDFGWL